MNNFIRRKYLIDTLKIVRHVIDSNRSRVRRNKFGELWSANNTGADVDSGPHQINFLEDNILANRKCCPSTFYLYTGE